MSAGPALGLTTAELRTAVETATRAPSVHNTQPWLFRLRDQEIEVYADARRQLTVADPTGTALRVSCGAAVFNLRLAFAHLGVEPSVTLMPDASQANLLARVVALRPRPATPEEAGLYDAIGIRHSNRSPFLDTAVPLDVRADLLDAARVEGAWLDLVIGPAALAMVAELVRAADRILLDNPAYRAELAAWTRGNQAGDGVSQRVGGPAPDASDLLARRDFGGPPRPVGRDYERDPLVCVLGGHSDSPRDDLTCGQALQRVLLTATSHGLAASLLSQPIDVPAVREQLRLGLRRYGQPQMLIRVGYGIPSALTSRRPVSEVIMSDPDVVS